MTDFQTALALTKKLVEIESVTPHDNGCQTLLAERLQAIGFNCESLEYSDGNGTVSNLWARRGTASPCLVLAGHTDVVPAGNAAAWRSPPFQASERDGYLYGRGTADMKCALAAFVVAAEAFVKQHPEHSGSLAFLITSDEEGPAKCGTVKVIEELQARGESFDYCLVGEPSSSQRVGDTIKNGRRGSLGGKCLVKGKQGHIAYPHLADNPIHKCGEVIQALLAIQWDSGNEYFPPTSFQISNFNAGTGASNVIPASAEIVFNLRFSTQISPAQIEDKIKSQLDSLGVEHELEFTLYGMPFLTKPGQLSSACEQAISSVTGEKPVLSTSGGTSDGRFIAPTGAQVVELGAVNTSIHQVNECISIDTPAKLAEIYFQAIKNLLF